MTNTTEIPTSWVEADGETLTPHGFLAQAVDRLTDEIIELRDRVAKLDGKVDPPALVSDPIPIETSTGTFRIGINELDHVVLFGPGGDERRLTPDDARRLARSLNETAVVAEED